MKCCICGREIVGYGNNPWPVNNDVKKRCCDKCDWDVVIPARIVMMKRTEVMKKVNK